MHLDPLKLAQLRMHPQAPAAPGELRRLDRVFLVAADLPLQPTLETIFESDCQAPVDLFWLHFADAEDFVRGEELVRGLKKNFRGYLLGHFDRLPTPELIERAYAAGLDLLQCPLNAPDPQQLETLAHGRAVFPPWSVLASLPAQAQSEPLLRELAGRGIVPWLDLAATPAQTPESALAASFKQLLRSWREAKVALKPLHPLLALATPLTPPPRPRGLGALLGRVEDARLRTSSDLRRLLRVREVAASFESAGL